jgi:hypothetical protein
MRDALAPCPGRFAKAAGAGDRHKRVEVAQVGFIVRHSAQPVRI